MRIAISLAYLHRLELIYLALVAGGAAWMAILSSLNVATPTSVPAWVRARSLSVYQLVFQGGIAVGSAIWGFAADQLGNSTALLGAAVGLGVGLIATTRYRLKYSGKLDLSPSLHWAEPVVMIELRPDDGPVLIAVEYHINPARGPEFTQAMHKLSCARRRDGAIRWGLFHDTADPSRYLETFIVESWAEHLRQHERVTVADRAVEEQARAFHTDDTLPIVSHLIYAHETRK